MAGHIFTHTRRLKGLLEILCFVTQLSQRSFISHSETAVIRGYAAEMGASRS
jgi:hypothetical protein